MYTLRDAIARRTIQIHVDAVAGSRLAAFDLAILNEQVSARRHADASKSGRGARSVDIEIPEGDDDRIGSTARAIVDVDAIGSGVKDGTEEIGRASCREELS